MSSNNYQLNIECSANEEEADALYQDVRLLMQKYNDVIDIEKCEFLSKLSDKAVEIKTTSTKSETENKRVFEIIWSGDTGPLWMNRDNLLLCLIRSCNNTEFTVRDVTGDGCDTRASSAGPNSDWGELLEL